MTKGKLEETLPDYLLTEYNSLDLQNNERVRQNNTLKQCMQRLPHGMPELHTLQYKDIQSIVLAHFLIFYKYESNHKNRFPDIRAYV